jgi:hypothetical protein
MNRTLHAFALVVAATLPFAGAASAQAQTPAQQQPATQQQQNQPPQPEQSQEVILIQTFNPKVGVGADYQRVGRGWVEDIELTTVGQEDVDNPDNPSAGKTTGYWVEQNSLDTRTIEKDLLVPTGKDHVRMARIVTQRGDDTPEEQPGQPPFPNLSEMATETGKETVTTPAGTFACVRFHSNDGKWDAWFSPEITPFGLVRVVNSDGTEMVVVRNLAGAKDHIVGAPRKPDPSARKLPAAQ